MLNYHKFYEVEELIAKKEYDLATKVLKEIQESYMVMNDENAKLRNQVHYLEELLYISRNLIFDGDAYWLISEGQKQGPFCPKCYHEDGSLIRLRVDGLNGFDVNYDKERWVCPHCESIITPEVETEKNKATKESAKVIPFIQ